MKGFFSQGMAVLLRQSITLDELEALLADFNVLGRHDAVGWELSGPSLVLSYRPEVNGLVSVDIVDRPWPDDMGHPQESPELFGGWSMGYFGPFTFPGSLERAVRQSWHWDGAAEAASAHRAFIRIRVSYIFGAGQDAPVRPEDYDPLDEVNYVIRVAEAILGSPAAVAFFNPNGEVILPGEGVADSLAHAREHDLPPLDLLANIRLVQVSPEWLLMDTIGMQQLDVPDHEACFASEGYDPSLIANFLRNVSLYRLRAGDVLQADNTTDGPNGIHWKVRPFEESLNEPPRDVLRWLPVDKQKPLPEFGF